MGSRLKIRYYPVGAIAALILNLRSLLKNLNIANIKKYK